jgi:hypothetical protein
MKKWRKTAKTQQSVTHVTLLPPITRLRGKQFYGVLLQKKRHMRHQTVKIGGKLPFSKTRRLTGKPTPKGLRYELSDHTKHDRRTSEATA